MNDQTWIKTHKKEIAEKVISRSKATSKNKLSGVFMAGLPGSGKTEFSCSLIESMDLGIVRIDMDEIATKIKGYRPENADEYRR